MPITPPADAASKFVPLHQRRMEVTGRFPGCLPNEFFPLLQIYFEQERWLRFGCPLGVICARK